MSFENYDVTTDATPDLENGEKLSAFQNPIYVEMAEHDLMPKIRFTTDKAEAEEAAAADRSNPFDLPDSVFYVGPGKETAESAEETVPSDEATDASAEKAAVSVEKTPSSFERGSFQNESFGIDVSTFTHDTAEAGSEYVGPSPDAISIQMESDVRDLTFAQEQLAEAIARGTGVMQAMRNVESAQAVLDARMKLYNEAIAFRAPEAPTAASSDAQASGSAGEEKKLGSVSHAEWELETAYKNDNKIAIENAKKNLAHEKAKEEAKK